MGEVYRLAQELAEAIARSEEYAELRAARAAADASEELCALEQEQQTRSEQIRAAAQTESGAALLSAIEELNARKERLDQLPEAIRLRAARQGFDELMENVNRILRMVINGDPEAEVDAGSGCAGCAGCGKRSA